MMMIINIPIMTMMIVTWSILQWYQRQRWREQLPGRSQERLPPVGDPGEEEDAYDDGDGDGDDHDQDYDDDHGVDYHLHCQYPHQW